MNTLIFLSTLIGITCAQFGNLKLPSSDLSSPFGPNSRLTAAQRAPKPSISQNSSPKGHPSLHNTGPEGEAIVLRQEQDISPDGSYQFNYETDNGIYAQEQGIINQISRDVSAPIVQGSYHYTAPDGSAISVKYIADINGFQPQGAHLPTPPPIPALILKALDYINAHPPQVEENKKDFK